MLFSSILETGGVKDYLTTRQLIKKYSKAKQNLLHLSSSKLDFKERSPKGSGIYSFRISKKYRALATIKDNTLIVHAIDDHQ